VLLGEVHTGRDITLTGRVDDVRWNVFRAAPSASGRHVAVHARTVWVNGDAPIESGRVDADWVVAVKGR
jgi:tRNA-dihydrouridine synthase